MPPSRKNYALERAAVYLRGKEKLHTDLYFPLYCVCAFLKGAARKRGSSLLIHQNYFCDVNARSRLIQRARLKALTSDRST